ncbi:MAG: AIR synthase-related protein [Verrucomicrobiales bacterium]|nr:AIR synthase-related protein [Verrucomicrobiales bacterium]
MGGVVEQIVEDPEDQLYGLDISGRGVFEAKIHHEVNGIPESVGSLFTTYFHNVSNRILERKSDIYSPGNWDCRGYLKLDDDRAVALRVDTQSYKNFDIAPFAEGVDTGASFDVFCVGSPDSLTILRFPSAEGVIQFDDGYIHSPLLFRGSIDEVQDLPSGPSPDEEYSGANLTSVWKRKAGSDSKIFKLDDPLGDVLKSLLSDFAIVSRESVIQGNDRVVNFDGEHGRVAVGMALLPEWGRWDPYAMGTASVDKCIRQLVAAGANPERIALQTNFCTGDGTNPEELGSLVETVTGAAKASEVYQSPVVSGRESIYREAGGGSTSMPTTLLVSGIGVIDENIAVPEDTLCATDSIVAVVGVTENPLGGSVLARKTGIVGACVPETNLRKNLALYQALYDSIKCGWIQSVRCIGEGGLAVALSQIAFGTEAGLDIDLEELPVKDRLGETSMLFNESPGRFVVEIRPKDFHMVEAVFAGQSFGKLGESTAEHRNITVKRGKTPLFCESLEKLEQIWKNALNKGQ